MSKLQEGILESLEGLPMCKCGGEPCIRSWSTLDDMHFSIAMCMTGFGNKSCYQKTGIASHPNKDYSIQMARDAWELMQK